MNRGLPTTRMRRPTRSSGFSMGRSLLVIWRKPFSARARGEADFFKVFFFVSRWTLFEKRPVSAVPPPASRSAAGTKRRTAQLMQ